MLGLGLAISVGKRILGGVIEALMSTLRGRAEYSENNTDSKAVVKDIDNYELLDKASILLTPTATSNARVHSVKTYTGDELVTNGTFDTDSNWTKGTGWSISDGKVIAVSGSTSKLEQSISNLSGKTCKVTFTLSDYGGSGAVIVDFGSTTSANINTNGEHTVFGTYDINEFELLKGSGFSGAIDNISVVDVSSDFDFDRASSATRINSDGLVQDMQSITDPELVLNGDFEELGDELVTNGTFDTDSNWTLTQATISNGVASFATTDGSFAGIRQNVFTTGKTYLISLDVSDLVGIAEVNTNGGTSIGLEITTNGTKSFYMKAENTDIEIKRKFGQTNVSATIDNVSVQQVDPNDRWSLQTGWSIEDGKLVGDGTNTGFQSAQQSNLTVSGNTYQVTLTIEAVSGAIELKGAGFYTRVDTLGVGTHTLTFVADATYFRFLAHAGATATIDNISVKDITFSEEVDLARINHDSNGENGHILLEPTSTNLVPYSENFEGGSWQNASVGTTPTLESGYTAPDGTNTAYKISNANQNSFWYYPSVSNTNYARTIWARTVSGTGTAQLLAHNSNTNNTFNLTETWQRFEINTVVSVGQENLYAVDFRGDGTLTELLIWGAQSENLSYATSYIPTLTGSAVTRATETLTGSGNSTLINSTEGVLYAEIAALAEDGIKKYISLSDGSTNNDVRLYFDTNGYISALSKVGGSTQAFIQSNAYTQTDFNKVAFKYKVNDFALWINGVEVATDNSGTTNTANSLDELNFNGNNLNFYGKCKALAVFNEALSDDELELLTGITNYGSFGELASANGYTII